MALIYIVEDDTSIRELESYALKGSGHMVKAFESSRPFFAELGGAKPDLIVLDIMLPEEDGLSILKKLRSNAQTKDILVILVTAKTTELDKVKGLDTGADDYIAKPFGIMEFLSRVKAVLRRAPTAVQADLSVGEIRLDDEKHQVLVEGKEIELTYKEFELLKYLMENENIVLSREKIMNKIWEYDFDSENRTVDVHIQTLRKKLGEHGHHIKTIRNVGYKLT